MEPNQNPEYVDLNDPRFASEQPQGPDVGTSLKQVGTDLLKFAVGMAVLHKATGFAAKSVFGRVMNSNKAFGEGISKVLGKSTDELSRGISLGQFTKGAIGTLAEDPTKVFSGVSKMGNVLSTASKMAMSTERMAVGLGREMMSSKNIGVKALGYAGRQYVKALPVAAGFYAISKPLGMGQEGGPAWYNVPGHIAAVGKMTAEFAAFDGGLAGLKKAGTAVGGKILSKLQFKDNPGMWNALDRTIGMRRDVNGATPGSFMNKMMQTAATFDGIRRAGANMSSYVSNATGRLFGNKLERDAQNSALYNFRNKDFYSGLKETMSNGFKAGYNSRMSTMKRLDTTYGTAALNSLTEMMAKHLNSDPKVFSDSVIHNANDVIMQLNNSPITSGFADAIAAELKNKSEIARKSFGSKLGNNYATVEDVLSLNAGQRSHASKIFHTMRLSADKLAGPSIDNLENTFMKMYAGKNVFKRSTGSIVDYSMYSPRNMLAAITNFITPSLNFTVPFTGGKQLPIGKFLGLERMLQGEGLNIGSIGTNDPQYYRDMVMGGKVTRVGQGAQGTGSGLGGVLVDGELFVNNATGGLERAATPRMRMVYSTPYARDSVLYKLHADAAMTHNESMSYIKSMEERSDQRGGFFGKISKFINNRGLKTPDMLSSFISRTSSAFGIGPQTMAVKEAADYILGTKASTDLSKADFTSIMSTIPFLGEQASKNLYGTLSNPKVLDSLAKLGAQNGHGFDRVGRFKEISKLMGGTDEELINYVRKNKAFENNSQLQYAVSHFDQYGSYGLDEQIGFKFGKQPMTKRDEIHRHLIEQAMGKVYGMGSQGGSTFNFAKEALANSETMKMFSKDELNDLHMLSTNIELHTGGFLGKEGTYFSKEHESFEAALDIVQSHFKDKRAYLEKSLYDTPLIHGVGFFGVPKSKAGIDRISWADALDKVSTGHGSPLGTASATNSSLLVEEGMGGALNKINYYVDRVMSMGTHFGFKYGMQERGDGFVSLKGMMGFLPKNTPLFLKNPLEKWGGKEYYIGGPLKQFGRRVAQGVGLLAAAQSLDTLTAINPMFDGTMFDDGLAVPAAATYVKASMAFHKVSDLTGVTAAAKYLDGLMPGSLSTIPGMIIGGMAKGPLGILPGAIINRSMDALGITPKFDKSYDEMADMYSGRELVPVRRNRFWLFSKAPYEGDGPQYFRPHWFPRLKSQYKYTDTLYGSKAEAFVFKPWTGLGFNPIGHIVDKYHYEKKHYWDRPYPVTEAAFADVPLIGPILGATIGRLPIIGKPVKKMHLDEMSGYYSIEGSNTNSELELATSNMPKANQSEQLLYMNKKNNLAADTSLFGVRPQTMNPYGAMTVLGEQMYNFTEFAGLPGYKLESLMGGHPGDFNPRYSTAGEMWSTRRAFWDLNMGDYFASTEFFRRFVPKEKKVWKKYNPIRNRLPNWLPNEENNYFINFLEGDPYTKIPEGEIRLPGAAYNKLYDVKRTFPGRASSLGQSVADLVKGMTGLESPATKAEEEIMEGGTELHRTIQDNLLKNNIGYKAEVLVYDAKEDISGHIDLVMYDPAAKTGLRNLEIKTMYGKKFNKLKNPLPHHVSQLNFYLKQMQQDVGTLLYVNRDDPSQIRTFDVRYSEERYRRDIQDIRKARSIAARIMIKGEGNEQGDGYSWLDRMRILGDVAPYSDEYKQAEQIVNLQLKANKLAESDKDEIRKIKQHRRSVMRKYDLYPTRFANRVFDPDTSYELLSENNNIKAAAEYSFSERMLGSLWERAIQLDTPLNVKLWNYQSPLQHYQRTKMYGTESAAWNRPIQDIIGPMFRKAGATDNPMSSAASYGWIGAIGLGGMGNMALPGAAFGAMYGAARSMIGGNEWIPDEVKKKREIERTFDQLKYAQNMNLYELTGDEKYQTEADNTLWSISHKSYQVGVQQAMRSLSSFEKPYFLSWMQETNPLERENILKMVPEEVGNLLKAKWGMSYDMPSPSKYEQLFPNSDWEGLMPNDNLSDIKVKTINQEGLRANDFGLGWYDQQRRISNSQFDLNPISSSSEVMSSNNVAARVKSALMRQLAALTKRPLIAISITPGGEDKVNVQLNIRRDRYYEMRQELRDY